MYFEALNSGVTRESCSGTSYQGQALATDESIGAGQDNTQTLAAACSSDAANSVFVYATEATDGGFNDWFIPSRDALFQLYNLSYLSDIGSKIWTSTQSSEASDNDRLFILYTTGSPWATAGDATDAEFVLVRMFTPSAPAEGSSAETPAPLIQQFGMPDSGSCADAAPNDVDWAGVSSGGWGQSWAQWMNNGQGGAVCTRTLVYRNSQSRWVLSE